MAFPTVLATNSGRRDTTALTHSVNLPTGSAVAGKLLIVLFVTKDTLANDVYPTGTWNHFFELNNTVGSSAGLSAAWRRTDGTETGSISITTSANTRMAYASYLIDGAENPNTQPPQATGTTATNSSNPNPPALTPTGGAKDYLWLAVFGSSHGAITSGSSAGLPANYTNNVGDGSNVGTTTHCGIGSGRRQLNAASEDPGAFTIVSGAGAEESVAATIVIHPAAGASSYDVSVSLPRVESVSDRMTNTISSNVTLAQKDGFVDGMGNSIPQVAALNERRFLTDSAGVGIFQALALMKVLSENQSVLATMQGSVGLPGLLGINGSPNSNVNPNATLSNILGINLSGGLSLLSDLTLAEKLGITVLGNVGVYPSLTLGRDLAFVPANIALIGGNVALGQALGLIDVPNLTAQSALSLLGKLGISLTSELLSNLVEAALSLSRDLGFSASAQLNSFPLVGIDKHLFILETNNANMFGREVLSEIRGMNVMGGLALQGNVAIPIDLNILTQKLVAVFKDVTVSDRLGITESAQANMQAALLLGETAGMGNAVNQALNAGLQISIIGSVLTISGINVIIVKGFVFTSDSAKSSSSTSDYSRSASASDSAKGTVGTDDS